MSQNMWEQMSKGQMSEGQMSEIGGSKCPEIVGANVPK